MINRETTDFWSKDYQTGQALLFDKPIGWTSFKVVHKVRSVLGAAKVGHAGTLDPMASGLLILCTGKMTKDITKYQDLPKTYTGTITLGKSSPSMDLETPVSMEKSLDGIGKEKIIEACKLFSGNILQTPPMYSAIKLEGKTLYNLARKGKTVHREPRQITVYRFSVINIELPDIYFEIVCSKGTYIRVIANDLGEYLGCGALLSSLRRTYIGQYSVESAFNIKDFTDTVNFYGKKERAETIEFRRKES